MGLLKGDFCTNEQTVPAGVTSGGRGGAPDRAGGAGFAPDATPDDYAMLGTTTGVQITLIGDAKMTITDAEGRRLSGDNGLLAGYADTIPGATLVEVAGAQVAALTTGGPFTVAITRHGRGRRRAAEGREPAPGAIVRTLAFPGIPMTTTTTAGLSLASASVEPETLLTYRYTPASPVQELTAVVLDGAQAGDVTAPIVRVTLRL